MLQTEQNSVGLMMHFMARISNPEDLVADFCTETMAVGKECLLLSEHRRFVGCKNDECCVKEALPGLGEVYARQVLISESHSNVNEKLWTL